jgi:hypothetical protein
MTMRYVQVAQLDVPREFHRALQNTASLHAIPQLPISDLRVPQRVDLAALRQAVRATHHLFRLFQSQLEQKPRHKLRRLSDRLLKILPELDLLTPN